MPVSAVTWQRVLRALMYSRSKKSRVRRERARPRQFSQADGGVDLWVPIILSWPLTWSSRGDRVCVWLREHLWFGHCQYPWHCDSRT
jgi:hypothetical protein